MACIDDQIEGHCRVRLADGPLREAPEAECFREVFRIGPDGLRKVVSANEPLTEITERLSVDLHGVAVEVVADRPSVVDALASHLHTFRPAIGHTGPQPALAGTGPAPSVTFSIARGEVPPFELPASARMVYDSDLGTVWYVVDDDWPALDAGVISLDARLSTGRVTIRYASADDRRLALVSHPLFTLPLLETMRRRGRHPLHASCVGRRHGSTGAILFPGPSGSGKSTLSVALSRAGWLFVADDIVFLEASERDIGVLGFPDEIDLTDASVMRFPELWHLAGRETWGERTKHQVRIDRDLGREPLLTCRSQALLSPRLSQDSATSLEALSADAALIELLPNVLLTDAAASQRHLDVLARLVRAVPATALDLGLDLAEAVDVVARFVEEPS